MQLLFEAWQIQQLQVAYPDETGGGRVSHKTLTFGGNIDVLEARLFRSEVLGSRLISNNGIELDRVKLKAM